MPARVVRDNRAAVRAELRRKAQILLGEAAGRAYDRSQLYVPVDTGALKSSGRIEQPVPLHFRVVYGGDVEKRIRVTGHTRANGSQVRTHTRRTGERVSVDYALFVERGKNGRPFLFPAFVAAVAWLRANLRGRGRIASLK